MVPGEINQGRSMTDTTPSGDLLARTLYLVQHAPRRVTFRMMARASGTSPSWITRFARNDIPDPGIKRVQALHDYLVSEFGA